VKFPRSLAVLLLAVGLAGCGESYRYKLTMAVNTPTGVRRASSVVEAKFWEFWFPERGVGYKLWGEAVYLDLGAGERPLIALLTNQFHPKYGKDATWERDAGPGAFFLARLYDETITPDSDYLTFLRRIAAKRGARRITPADLPDLVTLGDVNDPSTLVAVDPKHLEATLGPNITWNEVTLEVTDEPTTRGLVGKLPWLRKHYDSMLDGRRYHDRNTVANTLTPWDFVQPVELLAPK
jgi:hypothetical protein